MCSARYPSRASPRRSLKWMQQSPRRQNGAMLAIDTNLIVRYLTGDHPKQSAAARTLIEGKDVFVCTTILMETEWVLRGAYGFAPDRVAKALTDFAGLPRVT